MKSESPLSGDWGRVCREQPLHTPFAWVWGVEVAACPDGPAEVPQHSGQRPNRQGPEGLPRAALLRLAEEQLGPGALKYQLLQLWSLITRR